MNETILSLSLMNERFSATAVHRGSAVGNWERPEPVTDFADFTPALREAIKQTNYAGTPATVVIAHQRLAQQLVETPPVKGQNLKWFVQRRVAQLKPFPSDAAWSYQPTVAQAGPMEARSSHRTAITEPWKRAAPTHWLAVRPGEARLATSGCRCK